MLVHAWVLVSMTIEPRHWLTSSCTSDDTPNSLAAPIVFDRNIGHLKHFTVILVYTLYSSFNYIRESSSIWSHTQTFLQNTKGKRVGHETKIVRDLYILGWNPNFERVAVPMVMAHLAVKGRKGKEEYLYSAFLHQGTHKVLRHGSHSFTCKQHHACLSFVAFTRCHHHSN